VRFWRKTSTSKARSLGSAAALPGSWWPKTFCGRLRAPIRMLERSTQATGERPCTTADLPEGTMRFAEFSSRLTGAHPGDQAAYDAAQYRALGGREPGGSQPVRNRRRDPLICYRLPGAPGEGDVDLEGHTGARKPTAKVLVVTERACVREPQRQSVTRGSRRRVPRTRYRRDSRGTRWDGKSRWFQ